jgi:hypothetical protein
MEKDSALVYYCPDCTGRKEGFIRPSNEEIIVRVQKYFLDLCFLIFVFLITFKALREEIN